MSQTKGNRLSRVLVRHRDRRLSPVELVEVVNEKGEAVPPPPPRPVSKAASKLARRFVRKYGKRHLIEIAGRGGRRAWAGLTPLERSIELRRRRQLGIARKRALIADRIKKQLGR